MSRKPVLFFGVNSEGMGHATRARPIIEALSDRYEVHVFCGGRVFMLMRQYFPHVHRVWFGKLVYRNNRADVRATVIRSFLQGPYVLLTGAYVTLLALLKRPVAFISDFECLSAWAGMLTFGKVITLDNQQLMQHGNLPAIPAEHQHAAAVVRRVMRFNTPLVHRTLISSFYQPGLRAGADASRVRFVPAAIRSLVRQRIGHTRSDGPVLVYQTSMTNQDLHTTLQEAARETSLAFVVYGTRREGDVGKVSYRSFSEEGFVDDLANASFVLMNGGHSTICEALALGKPVLAEPVRDQFEQEVNVWGLEALGVGRGTRKLSAKDIAAFSQQVPLMRKRIEALHVVDNEALLYAVEETLHELNPQRALPPRQAAASNVTHWPRVATGA
jgi:uncharacterized protein (TIGR00661 family)